MAEVVIVNSPEEGGALAADIIERLVKADPEAVLGLATGSTPLTIWRSSRPAASTSPGCAASRSTSTWDCRQGILSPTAR